MTIKSIEEIEKQFRIGVSKRYLYRDKEFDSRGIDYKRFIKMRYSSFDSESEIIYSVEGWKILWYLVTRANHGIHIQTTPNLLIDNLNMSKYKVLLGLNKLIDTCVISCLIDGKKAQKITKVNSSLDIIIKYNQDELMCEIDKDNLGFVAIPYDFVYRAITDMNEYEWTIFTYLLKLHRYYKIEECVNQETGEWYKFVAEYGYAFPKQDDIAKICGLLDRHIVKQHIESLHEKGYLSVDLNPKKINKEGKILNENYKYFITLLNKFEYIKNQIITQKDKLTKEEKEYCMNHEWKDILNKNELWITNNNKLYCEITYGTQLNEYQHEYNRERN